MVYEFRCSSCGKLLLREVSRDTSANYLIQIKCNRCKEMNWLSHTYHTQSILITSLTIAL